MNESIRLDHNRIVIDGKPRVLLCASLFPFRVPRGQWRQRLDAVRRLGYHAIDVYIPWNFHETAPGVWNFSGRHNIEEFLRMTHEAGLYAMVRPGPYICSEWDGGAIPAWVATDPKRGGGESLRQNDPAFLDAVRGWYDRILPIIVRQQYGHGGPIIAVQADNELDFFACRDPHGYIGALADMMREAGVDVPIVACAGQGDMERAFGGAAGVTPAVNLYGDDDGLDMDEHIRYYREAADRYDVPLIVTETNRWHRTLRRMVGAGARFVGPFLQVSGWDFDFTPSVNNWGRLESYMTHDYDFGGVIDPAGQERADADDARRLSAIIGALGERLAAAEPAVSQHVDAYRVPADWCVDGVDAVAGVAAGAGVAVADGLGVGVLDLAGGGQLVTLTNVSRDTLAVQQASAVAGEHHVSVPGVTVPAGAGVMIVRDLPVDDRLTLCATSAELTGLCANGDDDKPVVIELSAPTMREGAVWAVFAVGDDTAITVASQSGDVTTAIGDGALTVSGAEGVIVFTTCHSERTYRVVIGQPVKQYAPTSAPVTTVTDVDANATQPAWSPIDPSVNDGRALPMEDVGVYAGAMRYEATLDTATYGAVTGVVLRDAADTISVQYRDRDLHGNVTDDHDAHDIDTNDHGVRELFTPWRASGGGALYVPFVPDHFRAHPGETVDSTTPAASAYDPTEAASHVLTVTARIWGHCNFDDSRLPSLRLTAKRGITGALAVTDAHDLGSGWIAGYDPADPDYERSLRADGLTIGTEPSPRGGLGWSTTVWPHRLAYVQTLHVGDTAAALHVVGGQARLDVRLNGRPVGSITPLQPTLWLGDVHDGDELTVIAWQMWGEDTGRATLLTGHEITGWRMASQGLPELRVAADGVFDVTLCGTGEAGESVPSIDDHNRSLVRDSSASDESGVHTVKMPLTVAPGDGVWLRVPAATLADAVRSMNTVVRFDGDGLQLTAFTDDMCLGRVVLGGLPGTTFGGGRGDLFLVPEESAGDLRLYAEATRDTAGTLNAITLGGPVDLA
ncbi:beta-galactosidase [Bifidobacterium ramosum]|nr:beta-galactosidase [Bifidobacterium ramosum]KAB8287178.1 beta-galactosidase [Bifidobacterium ramosum]